ncbi:ABC transporter substrate-binding protein [Cohnella sp.]|uniref:ABC transporter substrate-binding protein n=1 Tax=Cohnella sp. TaxID=1883426 RepID=UPI00356A7108
MKSLGKRLVGGMAAAAVAAAVLGGCGQKGETGDAVQSASASQSGGAEEKVTIRFTGIKTFGEDSWTELVKEFEAQNPDIEVDVHQLPPPSMSTEIHQYLVTALSSGEADIDVFTGDVVWVPEFASAGWTEPMDAYVEKDQYYPGVIEALTYQGQLAAMPWYVDGGMLYYRKDLLEKYGQAVPQTWDELVKTAQFIVEKEQNPKLHGFLWQGKQAEVLVCDFVEFLTSAGGAVVDENEESVIDSPATEKALAFMKSTLDSGISPKSLLSYDEEPSRTIFTDGNAVFLRNWSYVWNVAQDEAGSKVAGKVGVAPLPAFEGGKSASTMGGYQFMVAQNSKHKEAAVKFAQFLSSKESQLYFAKKMAFSPTRPSVLEDEDLKRNAPFLTELSEVFNGTVARPITPKYPQISLKLQAAVSAVLSGSLHVDRATKQLDEEIRAILNQ